MRRVVVLVLDLHQVQATGFVVVVWSDAGNDAPAVADAGQHTDAGHVGACLWLLHTLSCRPDPRVPPIGGDVSGVKLC